MYQLGDDKIEVRELLVKAFASAWECSDKHVDRDTYINSSINVIDSLQVGPEMIYGEEGQGLLEGRTGPSAGSAACRRHVGVLRGPCRELFHPDLDDRCREGRSQGGVAAGRRGQPCLRGGPETGVHREG